MKDQILSPHKSLNKAYRKVKANRADIERFKSELVLLLNRMNEGESEEYHKNLLTDFLRKTYYDPDYFINTKGRNDLVIHNGKKAKSSVGVIIEAKKPGNKAEMPNHERLDSKAFQELLLYYLRERFDEQNLELKQLIVTDIHSWYVFDASVFEQHFGTNKKLLKEYKKFRDGQLSGNRTDFFYKEIASRYIQEVQAELEYTYFDIRDIEKPLRNDNKKDDHRLIKTYKILSPEHMLKRPFANDSNSLDKRFYSELLHLIGLVETKEKNKKVIERKPVKDRDSGSLIENAINELDGLGKIDRLTDAMTYGADREERLFNVALELSITWINRVLFLKLLEAQLISYHGGDRSYSFLNSKLIKDYDDLNTLFFKVLARTQEDRGPDESEIYKHVPYLNSSLFEATELEHQTLAVSNLRNERNLPVHSSTVLKDSKGKRKTGEANAIEYLLAFLDAYDFSTDNGEEIQEDNKQLINASVLGLIFEKINGYKDGSFFTPGFITMYMCKETLRRAVIQKFNEAKGWNCSDMDALYNKIESKDIAEANTIINSLKICDPAVGSGHFLVSALNELIAIKNDLKILCDTDGKRLKEFHVEVVNDELVVLDEDAELFEYRPNSKESQRMQQALFHEKQTLIENCLFGVDINPNSVKICRLRLWIELLKNAYYNEKGVLETLPNIDINIKCGNSLISRFGLDADLKSALKKSQYTIADYRAFVEQYRHAENKEQKRAMEALINEIKSGFETEVATPMMKSMSRSRGKVENILTEMNTKKLWGDKVPSKMKKDLEKANKRLANLEAQRKEIEESAIYSHAFEWRFEFPEVLDERGSFVGFDVVIGNPPYIRQEEFKEIKPYLKENFQTYAGTADLFVYFIELGLERLRTKGQFTFIVPNKWMRAGYGMGLRNYLKKLRVQEIIDFGDQPVFEEATTYPCILSLSTDDALDSFRAAEVNTLDFDDGLQDYLVGNRIEVLIGELDEKGWALKDSTVQNLLRKLRGSGIPLGEYVEGHIYRGVLTGLNEAFVIDAATSDRLISENAACSEIIKPFLAGRDIKRYQSPLTERFLIVFPSGFTKERFGVLTEDEAWSQLCDTFSSICHHLLRFEEKARARWDKGDYWWELRPCDYYNHFDEVKIMIPDIALKCQAILDDKGSYCVNTAYIIPGLKKYDLGLLNSKLILFYYASITQTVRGGYYRFIRQYLETIPFVEAKELEPIVVEILRLKSLDPTADTSAMESEIDQLVYRLYNLTEEEIAIVEGVSDSSIET